MCALWFSCIRFFVRSPSQRLCPARAAVVLFGGLVLAACQTTGGAKPDGETAYSFFYTPADHIEELLQAGDQAGAFAVYGQQADFFAENAEKHGALTGRLTEAAHSEQTPLLEKARNDLTLLASLPGRDGWADAKSRLTAARTAFENARTHPVLTQRLDDFAAYGALQSEIEQLEKGLRMNAAAALRDYPLATEDDFFAAYPLSLDREETFSGNRPVVAGVIDRADEAGLARLAGFYGDDLPADLLQKLKAAFIERAKAEAIAGGASAATALLQAVAAAGRAGIEIEDIPGARVALVEATSPTLLAEGAIDFPAAIEIDLPFTVDKTGLETAMTRPGGGEIDIVIVIDVAEARATREIGQYESVNSEHKVGMQSIANPEYDKVDGQYEQAKMEYQSAQMSYAAAASQPFLQLVAALSMSEKKEILDQAFALRQSVKKTKEVPVWEAYAYKRAALDAVKTTTVHYHILDRGGRTYSRGIYDAREAQTFDVAYNVSKRDRKGHDTIYAEYDREDDVVAFEKAAISVKLSDILSRLSSSPAKPESLPGMTALKTIILEDKNRALAAHAERQFRATPAKDDPRFESVVFIHNPKGGFGSGFYINETTIMTNYHVIEGANFFDMKRFDGSETFGKLIAQDIRRDLALIQVQARGEPVKFYNRRDIELGAPLEVIGNPGIFTAQGTGKKRHSRMVSLDFSITRGIVSAVREMEGIYAQGGKPIRFIQTDAAINRGNSGGPVFLNGAVVGISDWGPGPDQNIQEIAFVIHYAEAADFLRNNGVTFYQADRNSAGQNR